ncbi:GNAT family N-acetyltransferase [Kosmotoga pacifica]|uniref:Acetyltransferase n=1 Tax=Kosmotoga pacifica TaxID=1330330 RepID=A0A0G2Z8R2_9BACT|nr:GNAT family N-acetyltransferase [Kosmotoga pacifica]AKI97985.1 acetyltransferase [Kosmotoga pacifica]
MKKVSISEAKKLFPFLSREKEFNLFIIGDIENAKPDADYMEIFVDGQIEQPRGVLLRYYRNFVIYSPGEMDYKSAAEIVRGFDQATVLSGKACCIDKISPFLRDMINEESTMHFAVLREPLLEENTLPIRRASVEDARKLLDLLDTIEEFHEQDEEAFIASIKDGTTRRYILEKDGKIVSTAASTAETSDLAMIIGVATHKDYRNRGFASKVMSKLCSDLLAEGKTPCLFYDNPKAGKIYNRLGFREIGKWKMLRFK